MAQVTEASMRYRIKHGHFPLPNAKGLYSRQAVLVAIKRYGPRRSWGGRPGGQTSIPGRTFTMGKGQRTGRGKQSPVSTDLVSDVVSDLDPATRFRLAKAQQEEIKLKKLQDAALDVAVVERRVFALFHLLRDRMLGWVSQAAPLIAATIQTDEGQLWRAMTAEMRKLLADFATMDLKAALVREVLDEPDALDEDDAVDADVVDDASIDESPPSTPPPSTPPRRGRPPKTP